ncbi:non-ribosomal peptide synthetase [Amycolatopsis sp. NPDC005003]
MDDTGSLDFRRIAEIWASVLGIEMGEIADDDDFFELGGNSLLAARIQLLIAERFSVRVALDAILAAPTVREVAQLVAGQPRQSRPSPVPEVAEDEPGVLSPGQERLWFLRQLDPESPFYHVVPAIELRGELSVPALEAALLHVFTRHEVLRTVFPVANGSPVATVLPPGVVLQLLDLSGLPPSLRDGEVSRLQHDLAVRPFDLATGPITRTALVRLADDEHRLVVVVHHIAFDGASQGILMRDLTDAYRRYRAGSTDMPERPRVQYQDFARWQRARLSGSGADEDIAFWTRRLAGAPAAIELPSDRPRPARQSFAGDLYQFSLPGEVRSGLPALCREHRVTPFMVLLTAFSVVLSAYGETKDVVVGAPAMSRGEQRFGDLIGFFINTIPLRCDLTGAPTFAELLRRVRETCFEAYAHQEIPFEKLVEALRPPRDPSRAPLVQVLMSWEDRQATPAFDNLRTKVYGVPTDTSKLDLSLFVQARPDVITATVEYATDLFDEATIRNLTSSFVSVLGAAVATPDRAVAELPLLSSAAQEQVLHGRHTTVVANGPANVAELVVRQAAVHPARVAVRAPGLELTYAQLLDEAHGMAATIQRHVPRPETPVGILARRSPQLVVAMLATLLAGHPYLPLDPEYPSRRLRYMIADSGTTVLLSDADHPGVTTGFAGATVPLVLGGADTGFRPPGTHPGALAYLIYTSGSTGTPKGTAMPHAALVNLLRWQLERSGLEDGEATLQFPPFSFDMSFLDIFYTLAGGRTLVFAPEEVRRDPAGRADFMAEENVGCFVLSPAALYQQAAHAGPGNRALSGVREFISAGEQLNVTDDVRSMFAERTDCVVVNQYGPTETHCMTAYELVAPSTHWPAAVPIGRPIPNTRAYVLDAWLNPVPPGVSGELYLAGECLARGYAGRPGLTAERFVPDPHASLPGARMYRTGDRARLRSDGDLEFLGRLDSQLKVRGFRIEPAEVEAALTAHPAVEQAVVAVHQPADQDPRLVAYVVGGPVSGKQLRGFLRDSLPSPLIPDVFVPLDVLPMTPSGKVDRRGLPAPEIPPRVSTDDIGRGGAEQAVYEAWSEILGHRDIEADDNFFEVGGNSLLISRLHSLLMRRYDRRIDIVDLFRHATVADQAALLTHTEETGGSRPARTVDRLRRQRTARQTTADQS